MEGHDRLADWVALLDGCYPEGDAEAWDATGLQVGAPDEAVRAVLVCLDVTADTLHEAAQRGADLVLAHHPLLFRPLARLTPASAPGRLALQAARSGIAVLAAHTNFDVAEAGTTEPILHALGITEAQPLERPASTERLKLVTFVPPADTAPVLAALAGAGAGVIGEYDHCSYRVSGTGTFRPSARAQPHSGERERLNEEHEERLEIVVPRRRLPAAIEALVAAHPYEEVAYDVYPLAVSAGAGAVVGLGRIGKLPAALSVGEIADRLATALPAPHLRVAGDPSRRVLRVAACGGAGDSLIPAAIAAGAELYVTGDLRHHVALDALTLGLSLIDAGHHATETAALPWLIDRLRAAAARRGLRARLLASAISTDPWGAYRPPGEAAGEGVGGERAQGSSA